MRTRNAYRFQLAVSPTHIIHLHDMDDGACGVEFEVRVLVQQGFGILSDSIVVIRLHQLMCRL